MYFQRTGQAVAPGMELHLIVPSCDWRVESDVAGPPIPLRGTQSLVFLRGAPDRWTILPAAGAVRGVDGDHACVTSAAVHPADRLRSVDCLSLEEAEHVIRSQAR